MLFIVWKIFLLTVTHRNYVIPGQFFGVLPSLGSLQKIMFVKCQLFFARLYLILFESTSFWLFDLFYIKVLGNFGSWSGPFGLLNDTRPVLNFFLTVIFSLSTNLVAGLRCDIKRSNTSVLSVLGFRILLRNFQRKLVISKSYSR